MNVSVLNIIMRHLALTRVLYRNNTHGRFLVLYCKLQPLVFWDLNVPEKKNASHNHFFLDKQFRQILRKQFLSWCFLTYCAIIATQWVSCALFWRDFSNALMAGQLPSSKSIKRLWCEQPLSPVRMKLKVIIVQSAGNSQRDEWWHTFNMDLFCEFHFHSDSIRGSGTNEGVIGYL